MWKKRRWYIWDSNLGPHDLKDGRRKQINWDIEDSNLLGWSYLLSSEKNWLWGRYCCFSPSTKELHGWAYIRHIWNVAMLKVRQFFLFHKTQQLTVWADTVIHLLSTNELKGKLLDCINMPCNFQAEWRPLSSKIDKPKVCTT